MHSPKTILHYEIYKFLRDSSIQTDHPISARQTDQMIVQKKKKKGIKGIVNFAIPTDHKIILKESEKDDR